MASDAPWPLPLWSCCVSLLGVVLEKGLTDRLQRVAISTANTKANGAPFRNLLLHGPPGTGTRHLKSIITMTSTSHRPVPGPRSAAG